MSSPTKLDRQAKIKKVMAGISKYYGAQPQVTFAGTTFTPAALLQFLQTEIDAIDTVDQEKAAYARSVQAERTTRAKVSPILVAIRSAVVGQYGTSKEAGDVLAVFGYSTKSSAKPKVKDLVVKVAKAVATRAARGTKSKKAKAKIKGTPQGTPATPPSPKA